MDDWVTVESAQIDSIQLLPDGTLTLAGIPFPIGAAVADSQFGDVLVNKPAGAGQVITLTTPKGTISTKYEGNRWHLTTDIPELLAEMAQRVRRPRQPAAMPSYADVPGMEVPFPEAPYPLPDGFEVRPNRARAISIIAVLLFVVVALAALLWQPLRDLSKASATRAEKEKLELEAQRVRQKSDDAYLELETDIRQAHTSATRQLLALKESVARLDRDFESVIGIPLAAIVADSNRTPPEVDDALLEEDVFLRAWNQLLNAYLSASDLAEFQTPIDDIGRRITEKKLQIPDQTRLADLTQSMQDRQARLAVQPDNLRTVRRILANRRLEQRSP